MADGRRGAALDLFRLAAVVLVVANHTSPRWCLFPPLWDFWFTRVLARVAVPFFPDGQRLFSGKGPVAQDRRLSEKRPVCSTGRRCCCICR